MSDSRKIIIFPKITNLKKARRFTPRKSHTNMNFIDVEIMWATGFGLLNRRMKTREGKQGESRHKIRIKIQT